MRLVRVVVVRVRRIEAAKGSLVFGHVAEAAGTALGRVDACASSGVVAVDPGRQRVEACGGDIALGARQLEFLGIVVRIALRLPVAGETQVCGTKVQARQHELVDVADGLLALQLVDGVIGEQALLLGGRGREERRNPVRHRAPLDERKAAASGEVTGRDERVRLVRHQGDTLLVE
ncbi:hypothetical protein HYQ46_006828 [Verticillium longisporum]|nr:hypothetical protein HYQ46_006828 [Verticillium longisporum]